MEGGKCELGEFEGGVGEDGFVREDLYGEVSKELISACAAILHGQHTMPMVANVFTTIQMIAALAPEFSGSGTFSAPGNRSAFSWSEPVSKSAADFNLTKLPSFEPIACFSLSS